MTPAHSAPPDELLGCFADWSSAADDLDRPELALTLLDQTPRLGDRRRSVLRARLLLLVGRPADAVEVLRDEAITELPAGARASWPYLVLAASLAATGDMRAYHRLLATAARVEPNPAVSHLVAVAAEHTGDTGTADSAWLSILADHGVATPTSVARFAVAAMTSRDRHDFRASVRDVVRTAASFRHLDPPLAEDPQPVLDAADALCARGDEAGARLLVRTVTRLNPRIPRLEERLRELTPADGTRKHRLVAAALLVGGALLIPLGVVAAVLVAVGRQVWIRRVPIPGLDRTDSVTWRTLRHLRFNPSSGTVNGPKEDKRGWYGLAGLAALLVTPFLIDGPMNRLYLALAASPLASIRSTLVASLVVFLLISAAAGGYLAARAAHRQTQSRRTDRRRMAATRQELTLAERCRCWQSNFLTGGFAVTYLRSHLVPVGDGPIELGGGIRGVVGRCPQTDTLWLHAPTGSAAPVLLRGSLPDSPDEEPDPHFAGPYL
ncbi:MAG: hypothetical protein QOI35_3390 [Cryptosporangiaceae bacterium]|nr:hypothetical protein [Cryptosporangiaceae bacterium]